MDEIIIERKEYLDRLIAKRENGFVKVITGVRRFGKSFLLFTLYTQRRNYMSIREGGKFTQKVPQSK